MEAILENIAGHGTGQVYALLVMGLLTLSIYIGLEKRWRRDGTRLLRHMVTAVCLLPLAVFLSALGRWSGPWIGSVAALPGALLFGISAFLFSLFFHGETWPSLTSAARSAYYQVTGVSLLVGLLILAFLPGEHPADGTLLAFCVLLMGAAFFLLPLPGIIMGDDPIWRKKTLTIGFLGAGVALHAASLLIGAPAATLLLHLSQIALIVGLFEIHCCLFNWNSVEIEVISGDGRTDRKTVYPIVDHPGPAWEAPIPGENPGKDLMPIVDPESLLTRYRETAALLRNRAKNLERILEIAVEINSKRNLQELLDKIVDSIREHLGFRIVLLRVLNRKTQVFEARAFAGLNNDAIKTLSEYRLPMAEYRMMTDERFRISRSYFISHEMKMWEEDEFSVVPQLGNRKEGQWHEMDMLIVPLETRVGEVIGYLSMDDPVDTSVPTTEIIEILEVFASQAVTAITNAELFNELERKNRKLEEAAEQLSSLTRLKSDFVSTISHELRTPLTSIQAYTETILSNQGDLTQETLSEFLSVINKESERLGKMIDDVLNLSRLEAEDMRLVKASFDMKELIETVVRSLESDVEARGVELKLRLPEQCPELKADRELIHQVVSNLMSNAIKFTPARGEVVVTLENQRSHLLLTVEDTGIGIPDGQLDAIFDRFHQADTSSTREFGGPGLGLAICKNIIDWHDGKIWVENRAEQGARFVVLLPKKDALVSPRVKTESSVERRYHRSRFLELLVEMVAEALQARVVSFMTLDLENEVLRVEAAIGLDEEIVEHTTVEIGSGVAGMVAETGRTILVENIETDARIRRNVSLPLYTTPSFVSAPIRRGNEIMGVFNVTDKADGRPFGEADALLLDAICKRVSYVWDKVFGLEEAIAEFDKVHAALRGILDATRYCGDRRQHFFAELAVSTAEAIGLGSDSQESILYGMTVYDLGMTRISTQVLRKRDPLSGEELSQIHGHVIVGSEIIDPVEYAPKIKEIVLYHHERFDGSGYPEGLRGEAIPLEARVVGIVDTFRSLLSERPYRPAMAYLEGLAEIRRASGRLFDPALVDRFIQVCHDKQGTWNELLQEEHSQSGEADLSPASSR